MTTAVIDQPSPPFPYVPPLEGLTRVEDNVTHPRHYTSHPSGIEIYLITQEMWCPNLANAFKYLARFEHKGNPIEDVRKAGQYIEFEIARRKQRWFWLPETTELIYEARYAPFYAYIAAEPDKHLAEQLVKLWNADKSEHHKQHQALAELRNFTARLVQELERREAEEPPAESEVDYSEFIGGAKFISDKIVAKKLGLPMQMALTPDENPEWVDVKSVRWGENDCMIITTVDGLVLSRASDELLRARNAPPRVSETKKHPVTIGGEFTIQVSDMRKDIDSGTMYDWDHWEICTSDDGQGREEWAEIKSSETIKGGKVILYHDGGDVTVTPRQTVWLRPKGNQ